MAGLIDSLAKIRTMRPEFVFLAALLLAACGPPVRLTQQAVSPSYTAGEFAYAAGGRDLQVVVAGTPFGGDPATFARAVTDAMQGRHWGPATVFTAAPGPSAQPAYSVVMLFDPPPTLTGGRLCRGDPSALPVAPAADRLTLLAAFCRSGRSLTELRGSIPAVSGPDDPIFAELVGQVTNGLFPPRRRLESDPGCPPWMRCR